jgi:sulfate permease, SulP family
LSSPAPPPADAAPPRWGWLGSSFRGYRRSWTGADAGAGLLLLAIAVPEQLATARLAGMPPVTGFYAFVAGTALFALLGANPLMSVGADSTIAPLFAVGIAHVAATGSSSYVALAGQLAVTVGVIVAVVGILRLGWIAELLSRPIITGFLAGVAVIIVVHELPDLFGVPAVSGSTAHRLVHLIGHLGATNGWSLGIGVLVFLVIIGGRRANKHLPGALIGLVASTAVVAGAGLRQHGVAVLGQFSHSAPHVGLTHLSWSTYTHILPVAVVVALVVVTQTAATTNAFGTPGQVQSEVSRDFIGVGAGSIASGLVGSFAVDASPARTAAVDSAGGRSQATGLGAALVMVVLVPALGLLSDLPQATLAAVLLYVASRIFAVRDLVSILRFDRLEFALALITLVVVAVVGVEQGIAVAVGLAILDRTRRSARPKTYVLGRIPDTTSWDPVDSPNSATTMPGVVAFFFGAPLYFANAGYFRQMVHVTVAAAEPRPRLFVLDAVAMSDIDYTGIRILGQVIHELDRQGVIFAVARALGTAPKNLAHAHLVHRIGRHHIFPSVDEAVNALAPYASLLGESTTPVTGSSSSTPARGSPR